MIKNRENASILQTIEAMNSPLTIQAMGENRNTNRLIHRSADSIRIGVLVSSMRGQCPCPSMDSAQMAEDPRREDHPEERGTMDSLDSTPQFHDVQKMGFQKN